MDSSTFDRLSRLVGTTSSRRVMLTTLLSAVLAVLGDTEAQAAKKRRKRRKQGKKKRCPARLRCGRGKCCPKGGICCNPKRKRCCGKRATCCNPGRRGTCCAPPNECGLPWGNDDAPLACCPPARQWRAWTGIVRCCPKGTRSLGMGISSDDGPCCPEEKYCSPALTGGKCCPDAAPICLDKAKGTCCSEQNRCGADCCSSDRCCNGRCCPFGQTCEEGTCKCPNEHLLQCGDTCCASSAYVDCDGDRCLLQCHIDNNCGG